MNLTEQLAKDKLADIAKGRYSKKQVEDMFQKAVYAAAIETEHLSFEYAMLMMLQTLHYDFGFGHKRLGRVVELTQPALEAFDAKAFDMDDMRQALIDDAHFEFGVEWKEGEI